MILACSFDAAATAAAAVEERQHIIKFSLGLSDCLLELKLEHAAAQRYM